MSQLLMSQSGYGRGGGEGLIGTMSLNTDFLKASLSNFDGAKPCFTYAVHRGHQEGNGAEQSAHLLTHI